MLWPLRILRQVRKIVGDMYVSVDEDREIKENYQRTYKEIIDSITANTPRTAELMPKLYDLMVRMNDEDIRKEYVVQVQGGRRSGQGRTRGGRGADGGADGGGWSRAHRQVRTGEEPGGGTWGQIGGQGRLSKLEQFEIIVNTLLRLDKTFAETREETRGGRAMSVYHLAEIFLEMLSSCRLDARLPAC
eukprot:2750940-Pleurochrysis_carterae.AAC.4